MRIRFWGTRGSIAKPGPTTVRYGGNTSCVEICSAAGTRLVLDCGTGAHALGAALVRQGPTSGHLLIGHTHWDHIQGLPFFAPLFIPGNQWDIHAPGGLRSTVRDVFAGQMQDTYFPVSLDQLGATLRFHELLEGTFALGDVRVTAHYLNHPAVTLGYRLEVGGVTVVYATDHEPHGRKAAAVPAPGERLPRATAHREDERHAAFLAGADLLIHDAQYTAAEYPSKEGWGHSTVEYVVGLASAAGVKRLALFHHDPFRTDDQLDALLAGAQAAARAVGGMEVLAAAEGQEIVLEEGTASTDAKEDAKAAEAHASGRRLALVAAPPAIASLVEKSLGGHGFDVAPLPASELAAATLAQRPALVVMACGEDGAAQCRSLRAEGGAAAAVPLVAVTPSGRSVEAEALFEAGATDVVQAPCSVQFLSARLGAWLLRTRARWAQPPPHPEEARRLEAVKALGLDDALDERFDVLMRLLAKLLDVPLAAFGVIDAENQWHKAAVGAPRARMPRDAIMCSYTLLGDGPLVVPDAHSDPTFGDNPAMMQMGLRFYAGLPIRGPRGLPVGTICAYDTRPRALGPDELQCLRDIGGLIERELAARAAGRVG